jgi:formate hydrogenlyase transcriptional activator
MEICSLLVEHFVQCSACKLGKTIRGIDPEALDLLEAYSWPGNVRELQNVIERSVIVCESETFTLDPSWPHGEWRPTSRTRASG